MLGTVLGARAIQQVSTQHLPLCLAVALMKTMKRQKATAGKLLRCAIYWTLSLPSFVILGKFPGLGLFICKVGMQCSKYIPHRVVVRVKWGSSYKAFKDSLWYKISITYTTIFYLTSHNRQHCLSLWCLVFSPCFPQIGAQCRSPCHCVIQYSPLWLGVSA